MTEAHFNVASADGTPANPELSDRTARIQAEAKELNCSPGSAFVQELLKDPFARSIRAAITERQQTKGGSWDHYLRLARGLLEPSPKLAAATNAAEKEAAEAGAKLGAAQNEQRQQVAKWESMIAQLDRLKHATETAEYFLAHARAAAATDASAVVASFEPFAQIPPFAVADAILAAQARVGLMEEAAAITCATYRAHVVEMRAFVKSHGLAPEIAPELPDFGPEEFPEDDEHDPTVYPEAEQKADAARKQARQARA